MEVISIENREKALKRAAEILRDGGIVAGPTDTVYGLFADATNSKAVQKLYRIKNRGKKAISVFVKDIETARSLAYISDKKARFLEHVWPGQVIVVFEHKGKLPANLTNELPTLGMRIPNHSFLQELLSELGVPFAQTSANISSEPVAKKVSEVLSSFDDNKDDQPDLVLDGGELTGPASVVVDFTKDSPLVLRTGIITKGQLEQILGGF